MWPSPCPCWAFGPRFPRRACAIQRPQDAYVMQGYAGFITAKPGQIAITSSSDGAAMHCCMDICGLAAGAEGLSRRMGGGAVWSCATAGGKPLHHQVTA